MTGKITIEPEVALREAHAELVFLRNRNLLLAQELHEARQQLASTALPVATPP